MAQFSNVVNRASSVNTNDRVEERKRKHIKDRHKRRIARLW